MPRRPVAQLCFGKMQPKPHEWAVFAAECFPHARARDGTGCRLRADMGRLRVFAESEYDGTVAIASHLTLSLTRRVLRDLRSLPVTDRERIMRDLEAYAEKPNATGHDVIPLVGTDGGFRLRTGDWRALFAISGDEMVVHRIGHRREIYRGR